MARACGELPLAILGARRDNSQKGIGDLRAGSKAANSARSVAWEGSVAMRILWGCLVGALIGAASAPVLAAETTERAEPVPAAIGYDRPRAPITYNAIYVYAGPFYGDSLQSSYVVGADYVLRFSDIFGIGPSFRYAHANFPDVPAYQDSGFIKSSAMYMASMLIIASMPTAYQVFGKVVEGELNLHAGAGGSSVNTKWGIYGFFGGGMKTFIGAPWFAFRIDIRGSIFGVETPLQGNQLNSDLTITFGPSFQLPPALN